MIISSFSFCLDKYIASVVPNNNALKLLSYHINHFCKYDKIHKKLLGIAKNIKKNKFPLKHSRIYGILLIAFLKKAYLITHAPGPAAGGPDLIGICRGMIGAEVKT
jgi:hypothetical protein